MQSWSQVRLGLTALGYSRVLTIEIDCPRCGIWRAEVLEEQEFYPCPGCNAAAKVHHVIECYTRRASIEAVWRQIEKPLSDKARRWLDVGLDAFLQYRGERTRIIRAREHAKRKTVRTFQKGQNLGVTDTRSASR